MNQKKRDQLRTESFAPSLTAQQKVRSRDSAEVTDRNPELVGAITADRSASPLVTVTQFDPA